jgi:hypothetical protein
MEKRSGEEVRWERKLSPIWRFVNVLGLVFDPIQGYGRQHYEAPGFISAAIFAAIPGLTLSARAQLDQPQAATDAFLGKPLSSPRSSANGLTTANYRNSTYDVSAGFKNDAAVYFTYKKRTGGAWSDTEIHAVLDLHRLGHAEGKWDKNIITGRHGPAVHRGGAAHINEAQHWHIFARDQYAAEYYPEKATLIIWDTAGGIDPGAILGQSAL